MPIIDRREFVSRYPRDLPLSVRSYLGARVNERPNIMTTLDTNSAYGKSYPDPYGFSESLEEYRARCTRMGIGDYIGQGRAWHSCNKRHIQRINLLIQAGAIPPWPRNTETQAGE